MKDSEFKALSHVTGPWKVASRGAQVSLGYKPDVTLADADGRLVAVLESEQKTDRKAFLGAVLKAERYAEYSEATPILVIVMLETNNATVAQIAAHLLPYLNWLHERLKKGLHLKQVAILSDQGYLASIRASECVASPAFMERAVAWIRPTD